MLQAREQQPGGWVVISHLLPLPFLLFLLPSWQGDPPAPSSFLGLQKGESCHVHGLMKTFLLDRKVFSGNNWIMAPQLGRQLSPTEPEPGGSIPWVQNPWRGSVGLGDLLGHLWSGHNRSH